MSEWQPIKTAPKDGTVFQVWISYSDGSSAFVPVSRFCPETGEFQLNNDEYGWEGSEHWTPTHWWDFGDGKTSPPPPVTP
jgi:hypothetical protein